MKSEYQLVFAEKKMFGEQYWDEGDTYFSLEKTLSSVYTE